MLVTVLGIAATAYGLWQSHWLAMIGAAAALFIAVLPAAGRQEVDSGGLGSAPPGDAWQRRPSAPRLLAKGSGRSGAPGAREETNR
jgi:hypothetical protein